MVERFDVDKLTPSPAGINFAKLDHFNGTHIRLLPPEELAARIKPFYLQAGYQVDDSTLMAIIPLIQERLVTLDDCLAFGGFFFKETVEPNPEDLVAKGLDAKQSAEIAREQLTNFGGTSRDHSCHRRRTPARTGGRNGVETQSGFWYLARGCDRTNSQPAAVREHGSDWTREGAGTN